jgi:hypothetical protein
VGLFNHTVDAYTYTMYLAEDAVEWSNSNFPIFVEKVRTTTGPWIEKARTTVGPLIDNVGTTVNSGVVYVKTNIPYLTEKVRQDKRRVKGYNSRLF